MVQWIGGRPTVTLSVGQNGNVKVVPFEGVFLHWESTIVIDVCKIVITIRVV